MENDIQAMIEKEKQKLDVIRRQWRETKLRLIEVAVPFIHKWYEETVQEFITKYSQKTVSLGKARLKEFKTEVRQLEMNIQNNLNDRIKEFSMRHFLDANGGLEAIDQVQTVNKALRLTMGELGKVLVKFGYLRIPGQHEYWGAYNSYTGNAEEICPYMIDFPPEIQSILQKYEQIVSQAREIFRRIHRLEREEQKIGILANWESL